MVLEQARVANVGKVTLKDGVQREKAMGWNLIGPPVVDRTVTGQGDRPAGRGSECRSLCSVVVSESLSTYLVLCIVSWICSGRAKDDHNSKQYPWSRQRLESAQCGIAAQTKDGLPSAYRSSLQAAVGE